jgi:peptide chain release factor 2
LRRVFDCPAKRARLEKLQKQLGEADFWSDQEKAQGVVGELKVLKSIVEPIAQLVREVRDVQDLWELAGQENDQSVLSELFEQMQVISGKLDQLELQQLVNGPHDMADCYFSVQAGAGGTESCDWAEMLLRMYLRYFQKHGYEVEEISRKDGDEAGIQSVTLYVKGPYTYGYLSCEMGVHRLVRISPFDSNHRRHTSFASVDVVPELGDQAEIEVRDEDLKIDFFRAGGAGGQHVNKVSSAVRLTHIPTGIVVGCQNERSQHQNRRVALQMLKAKLLRLEEQKRDAELAKIVGEKGEIAWGNQIRSYVLQPYQMVKDHRTDYQEGNPQAVLDGEIEGFIESYLGHRAKMRGKDPAAK